MGVEKYLFLISIFTSLVYNGNGCQMEGVGTWLLTQEVEILDTYRGTFWNRTTTSIDSMTSITVGGSVNYANYLDILWEANGYFTIGTSSGYELYEENETSEFISFTVNFACTGGTSSSLIFSIRVQDTNNNPPIFRPSDQYEFTITPPLPPGFQITGCVGDDIVVRDIDLTTSRIDFTIEDNPYFEISYEGRSSTDPKEFHASLTTKDLIRSLSEDLELIISATDVDATQDPRITTYATIRVKADEEFLFPEEPVFTQPFYTATYTNNQVVLDEVISLQQGYDDEVTFSLDGEYSNYFGLVVDGNAISIEVSTSLSNEVLQSGRIILVVKAEREYTSGTTATVIIQLPEVLSLEFEQAQYTGRIVDNTLEPLQLTLIQGYEEGFDINLQNEYSTYFSTSVQGNVITLSMPTSLPSTIIDENNFISLQVIASNELTTATTVVTLDIVKDDNVTPAFEKAIYTGDYDPNTGLVIEQIRLEQGYDQTLSFSLEGEHSEYFSTTNDGPVLTLTSSGIPTEIWMEHLLLLTVSASKPRTVTATATISITLPSARQLAFEAPTYAGTLQDNILNIGTVVLSVGFTENVDFTLIGDYASYFTVYPVQNEVTIVLSTPLPEAVISEINFLTLTLSASGLHAVSTSTTILLEITKQDSTTPVFTENIYAGSYTSTNSIEIGNISLAQGYDSSVTFNLDGEHAQYFEIAYDENNLNLVLVSDIPSEVIFRDKVLLFNILAEKALTVGANAAISITFPQELTDATVMRFSQNTYIGSVEDNTLVLENIILETGYETGTEFSLSGEYSAYFELQNISNVLNILIQNQLSPEILENNEFIILEVNASRERAVSVSSSIVIALEKKEIVPPVFSDAYYKSVYADGNLENLVITLSEGYDDTVTFELQGDNSVWFSITNVGNIVQLELNTSNSIPDDVLENNDYFLFSIVANKPDTVNAEAAIFIHLPKEITEAVIVRFSQSSYVGRIDNGELYAPVIELLGEREPISFTITGDYAEFFEVSQVSPSNVELRLRNGSLPENINELPFIIIDIEAQYPEAISGQTTVILEIVKEPGIVTSVFDQAYYIGEYSEQGGLQFEHTIRLSQGFDDSVVFTLAGDDAQWFELNNTAQNSLTLVVNDSGLEQIRDRSHLVFSVVANKIGSIAGHAAIIIGLSDALGIISLRFERDYYLGFIENNDLSINDLNMVEGYSPEINISFTGDHAEYFQLTNQEGIFTLQVLSELPADVIEDNNVLVFTLEAQAGNARTHTTIVLELIKTQQLGALAFEEIYYVGLYSIIDGFTFDPQITLTEGYDETVSFSLEGDDAHWFDIVENQYPLVLTQTLPIPNEVVSLSQQLIFVVLAEKPGSSPARSTIIVPITDDTTVLEFERNVYLGSIQESDGTATIDTIVLSAGYSANVSFNLFGDLESYFTITEQGVSVTVSVQTNIPSELIPNNGIIQLELQASAPQAISANTTLIYGIVRNDVASIQFSEIYYTGRYSDLYGLDFRNNVTLTAGYDDSVQFNLEGDDSQYFQTVILENSVSLVIASTIPTELIINRRPLIFTIRADKTDSASALATIVIELVNELQTTVLRFDQISYLGSMENNTVNLESVILSEGYTQNVSFNLQGDLNSYFSVSNEEAIVTISLETPIPQDLIQDNRIIILELLAYASNAMTAHTAIVIEVIQEEIMPALDQLVFSEAYYTGHYTEADGLTFSDTIILVEGFDENVTFALEGDSSQYFEAVNTDNSVTLRLTTPIPSAVVMNNPHLIFTIRADKLDVMTGRATVVIALLDEFIEDMVLLGFDSITYIGYLENNSLTLDQITLSEGYSTAVSFTLFGDLENYFVLFSDGATINITLRNPIPEQLIPDNRIIILEIEASAIGTMSAHAVIVIEVVQENITPTLDQLVFSEAYYTGHYTEADGLTFSDTIILVEGFDENVTFALEGDSSQYFEAVNTDNSVTLRLTTPIPSAVVMNNPHLIFTIRADKLDVMTGRATVVIALLDEFLEDMVLLGFDSITYIGYLENNSLTLDQITLSEGYSTAVSFTLFGDLENYFVLFSDGATINITLRNPIPEQLIPDNRIIILEIEASAIGTMSAHAVIVIEVVQENVTPTLDQLVFSEAYYTGHYTEADGLTFSDTIILVEGFDENVTFALEGDSSQYFEAVITDNSVTLRLTTPIPSAVVMNNPHLIFTIRADKLDVMTGRATVIIALLDEFIEDMVLLGFDSITYIGYLENNSLTLDQINLSEGYSTAVSFTLFGDLENYFVLTSDGATISITLRNPIPEQLIPDNRIIILEIEASATGTMSAHAVIVIEVVPEEITPTLDQLLFSGAYYTGHYTEADGLTFADAIILIDGYDENVTFALEEDSAQYFEAVITDNSVTLRLITPIPSAVVMNNHHLIFTIRADKPEAMPGRATIVIALLDEYIDDTELLGFDRITYLGSLENGSLYLDQITLSEGYSESVSIRLFGDLESYFALTSDGAAITITLRNPIPEQLIPDNRIIILEIEASATGTMSAHAVIVIEVVPEEITPTLDQLLFSGAYYTGHYTEADGLTFADAIILIDGYDENVTFALEEDSAQYFEAVITDNSVTLRLITPIPSAVVMNNHHLIFTIRADKPEAMPGRATIVIALLDEYIDDTELLGFDRITYLGSLENGSLYLDQITLSEGYSESVSIRLFGDLESYFALTSDGAAITITLRNPIPEQLIPDNRIIILEIEASATGTMSAHAVIVIEVVPEEITPTLDQLLFSGAYYTGHYTEADGLTFADAIILIDGYDENVTFALEEDSAQYFEAVITDNSVTLRLITPIPSAVVMNNHHLIFTIRADKPEAMPGRATIVIALLDEYIDDTELLGFDRITYLGSLENGSLYLDQITLSGGYSESVSFRLFGDLESYFALTSDGAAITITLRNPIPEQLIPDNRIIILEIEVSATGFVSAHAAIVIEAVQENITPTLDQLVFSESYYTGHYTESDGLMFSDTIILIEGFDENTTFALEGDSSQYFEAVITDNSVTLRVTTPIPSAVVINNHHLIFTINANKPNANTGMATIVIALLDEYSEDMALLGFDRIYYVGTLEDDNLYLDQITLSEGYSTAVSFTLHGTLNGYFTLISEGASMTITLNSSIPAELIPENSLIILGLEASAPDTLSAHATLVVKVVQEGNSDLDRMSFSEAYYTGHYSELEGLTFEDVITLSEGYNNNVTFTLEGDDSQYFEVVIVSENSISLRMINPIPSATVTNNQQLIFTIRASAPNTTPARATIVISLHDDYSENTPVLGFNRINYIGSIEGDSANIETIILSEGYSSNVEFTLHGDLQNYFSLTRNEAIVTVSLNSTIPEELIPSHQIIVLEIQASAPDTVSAYATVVFKVIRYDSEGIAFNEPYYTGYYSVEEGLTFDATISTHGYDESVQFSLEGDHSQWFQLTVLGNSVSLSLANSIPDYVLASNRKLIFVIVAQKSEISTRTTIIISLINEAVCSDALFGKVLYEGIVQSGEVQHEIISISGYEGTDIQLYGEHAELFSASLSEGVVTVQAPGTVTLSPDDSYVALELRAGTASAVLLLDVVHTENPELPSVSFSSSSYSLQTDVTHTGLVGRVLASADNGEAVVYSLAIDNTHLLERIYISDEGELYLWAPVNSGVYIFQVLATAVFSRVTGTATIHLNVEAITIWGDDDYVLPPLQILDRDEESPHENIVPFNASAFEGCGYILSNRWPADQSWLYVDETGLHAHAIDREHDSIALMALSQIQVELILQCDSDNESIRSKRSVNSGFRTDQLEHLGPYDYGNSKWIITDSINYNPRRTLVNLIVNDINDNYPIFIGKDNEPIVVGYPESDLEERILPRALVEVQATDADVGENAALVYWSTEEVLAVSPTTGSVHVRDIAGLESDAIVTVFATDRNGQGLTGSLDLLVKLVNTSHIAVVTIRNAFLDNEKDILTNLTAALGYEIKALKSSVISTESEEIDSRKKREAIVSSGSSLQLYVYGLVEREPVDVERLTEDINTSAIETVIIASTVSLEDHLENLVICPLPGRDTALFVSTIVLAVLLFILIVAAAVWYFLKWRKKQNYEEFSDENSIASRDDPLPSVTMPKPEQPAPRMNIEDLKRSERRLQEMLHAPLDTAPQPTPVPQTSEKPIESKVNIPDLPIVIQSFDKLKDADESDEDEFGERKKNRRKSVVTFNENVEKIIHVDPPDDSDLEVFRL